MTTQPDRSPARVAAARPVSDPAVDLVRMHRELTLLRMTRGLRWVGARGASQHDPRGLIAATRSRPTV